MESGGSGKLFRAFIGNDCTGSSELMVKASKQPDSPRIRWKILDLKLYVPADSPGPPLCLCREDSSDLRSAPSFTWEQHGDCSRLPGAVEELCFQTMSDRDALRYSYLLDEVV